jgi:EAL domain-containing protein (putative c-di-GMP-specific phosphodiesterase class I)
MSMSWFLEGAAAGGNGLLISIDTLPFRVGREASCELPVASKDISRVHARIERHADNGLQVTDLGSTNGSFVNRTRLAPHASVVIKDGDILHFGTSEFRIKAKPAVQVSAFDDDDNANRTVMFNRNVVLPEHFTPQEREFLDMLKFDLVTVALQPIVDFTTREPLAYEVLGRGKHPTLPQAPIRLLELAAMLGKEVELSTAFRMAAARAAASMQKQVKLFMNIHPMEMFTEDLYTSLSDIQSIAPLMSLVIEVHETAVAEVEKMKIMAARLATMGIQFAYDDFGAGQSRLNELAEVTPHVVKFDMALIRDIDKASTNKQQMITQLVQLVLSINSIALAEGVETEAEAAFCQSIGFQLCQGYLTGRPQLV